MGCSGGGVGHTGVRWGGSCRGRVGWGGVGHMGGVGHVGVEWGGMGVGVWMGHVGVECVMQGWGRVM